MYAFLKQYVLKIFVLVMIGVIMFSGSIIQVDAKGNDKNIKTTQNNKNTKSKQDNKNTKSKKNNKTKQNNKNKKHDKPHKGHGHKKHDHKNHKPNKPVKPKNKEVYKMLDGVNQVYSGSGTMMFRSNATFKKFTAVSIDGEIVSSDNYTVKEGSTIVTLNEDYCATLSEGEHTIKIISDKGKYATSTFTVEYVSKLSEYGFYFDKKYSTEYDTVNMLDISYRTSYIFNEDGTANVFYEINPLAYDKYKEDWDNYSGGSTYEEANAEYNTREFGSPSGKIVNIEYGEDNNIYVDSDCFNFSNDPTRGVGRLVGPWTIMLTEEVEKQGSYVLSKGINFNSIIPTSVTSIEFLSTAAPTNIDTIDVSADQDGSVLAWLEGTTFCVAPKVEDQTIYANPDSSFMFFGGYTPYDEGAEFYFYLDSINFSNFNTSKVTDMTKMFWYTSGEDTNLQLIGINNFDTSNVKTMYGTFEMTGANNSEFSLDLSNWDVSNVTNMQGMFSGIGTGADNFELIGLDKWDVSNVTDMSSMFYKTGYFGDIWNIGDLSNWNISNVTDMEYMFAYAGFCATDFNLDLSGWSDRLSNVKIMSWMFYSTGELSETFNLNLSNWNTSSVSTMCGMFDKCGFRSTTWNLIGLENWDVSNVKDFGYMFDNTGAYATTFNLDLSNWDVSSATDMGSMFAHAGRYSTYWSIGDITQWGNKTANVIDMSYMFWQAGENAGYSLNLKDCWDVSKVKRYGAFNRDVTYKVTQPVWVL